jgi:hypothetical protein
MSLKILNSGNWHVPTAILPTLREKCDFFSSWREYKLLPPTRKKVFVFFAISVTQFWEQAMYFKSLMTKLSFKVFIFPEFEST